MLSPFMVAMAPETPAQQPAAPAAVYNWENQGSAEVMDENGPERGMTNTGSMVNGIIQTDDYYMC